MVSHSQFFINYYAQKNKIDLHFQSRYCLFLVKYIIFVYVCGRSCIFFSSKFIQLKPCTHFFSGSIFIDVLLLILGKSS